jgi:hypothetical protein
MRHRHLLTPILPEGIAATASIETRVKEILGADPALVGRAGCGDDGEIVLTGPNGSGPPNSAKDRERLELHVRLRIAADLSPDVAEAVKIRWA